MLCKGDRKEMGDRVYFAFVAPLVLAFASSNLIPRGPLQTFLLVASAGTFVGSGFVLYGSGILRTTVSQEDREYNLRFLVYWLLYFGFTVMAMLFMVVYPLAQAGSSSDTFPKTMVTPLFSISWALFSYVAVFSAILTYHPMSELKRHLRFQRMLKDVRYDEDKATRNLARKDNSAQLERIKSHISKRVNRRERSESSDGETSTVTSISTRSTAAAMGEAPVYKYTDKFNGFLQNDRFMAGGAERGQQPLSWWYYVSLQFMCAFLSSIALVCVDFFNFTHPEKFVIVMMYLLLFTALIDLTIDITGKWKFLALPSYTGFNNVDASTVGADSYVKTTFTALLVYLMCASIGVMAMVTNARVAWLSGVLGLAAETLVVLSLFMYRDGSASELDSVARSNEQQTDSIESFGFRVFTCAFKVLGPEIANIWSIAARSDASDRSTDMSGSLDNLGISAITQASEEPRKSPQTGTMNVTGATCRSKNLKESLVEETPSHSRNEETRAKSSSIWSTSSSVAGKERHEAFTDEEELCRESDYVVDESERRPGAVYEDSDDESDKDPNYLGHSETEMGLGYAESEGEALDEEDYEDGRLSEYYSDTESLGYGIGTRDPMLTGMYPSTELRHRGYSSDYEEGEPFGMRPMQTMYPYRHPMHPYGNMQDAERDRMYRYGSHRHEPYPQRRYSVESENSMTSLDSGHTSVESLSLGRDRGGKDRDGLYEGSTPGMKHEKRITRVRRNPYEPGVKNRTEVLRKSYTDLDRDGKLTNTYHDTVTSVVTKRERNRKRKIVSKTKTIRKQKA